MDINERSQPTDQLIMKGVILNSAKSILASENHSVQFAEILILYLLRS